MSTPRKLNSPGDGQPLPALTRLKQLPMADREIIYGWCNDAEKTLRDVRGSIVDQYQISLSSDSQLTRFRDWQYLQQRTERLNDWTENFQTALQEFNPSADLDQVRQFIYATLMKESAASGNAKLALDVLAMDLAERSAKTKAQQKERDQQLTERRIRLLEQKAEQADQAKGILQDGQLNEEEKAQKMRGLFGIAS